MASVIEVCNQALSHLRAGGINSLEERSVQAQTCKLHFDSARDQMLANTDWPFNHVLKPLALLTDEIIGWTHIWIYPSDCLHVNALVRQMDVPVTHGEALSHCARDWPKSQPVARRLYNLNNKRVIATNESDLWVDYRARVVDMNLWDVEARIALSYLLASYMAISLAGVKDGRQLRTDTLALYNAFKTSSANESANQQYMPEQESEFITIRRGY